MNIKKGLTIWRGSLPPDRSPERCNTPYLARQGVWKGVRTIVRAPFYFSAGKTWFMEDTPSEADFFCQGIEHRAESVGRRATRKAPPWCKRNKFRREDASILWERCPSQGKYWRINSIVYATFAKRGRGLKGVQNTLFCGSPSSIVTTKKHGAALFGVAP